MSISEPTKSKWDLALDGISELGRKMEALHAGQEDLQDQINGLRSSYTRAAPMMLVMGLEGRITALESGVAARILAHMEEEKVERVKRQDRQDRRNFWLMVVLISVVVALLILAGVVVWAELHG